MNLTEITNRLELKELVDTFSTLADTKDVVGQLELFTEDAKVVSEAGDQTFKSQGKKAIGQAFTDFLALFHTVYHSNGQQTVTFESDERAKGISYCQVVLISEENGKDVMLTQGVRYHDTYVKVDGKWLIEERHSYFKWSKQDIIEK